MRTGLNVPRREADATLLVPRGFMHHRAHPAITVDEPGATLEDGPASA